MRKFLFFPLTGLLLTGFGLSAAPARKGVITRTQPDGSKIEIIVCGDERCGYVMTPDSVLLQENPDGFLIPADNDYSHRLSQRRAAVRNAAISPMSLNDGEVPTTGELHGLIILAEYPDVPFAESNNNEAFVRLLNEEGYSANGATGSVRDYYIDQSYGLFRPTFDVVGPVVLPNNMDYYGADRNGVTDPNAYRMIVDACKAADEQIDFSIYDNNGDGAVDLVYVIYSGYAQSNGASTATVWPHMWFLSKYGASVTLDGMKIDRYACSAERIGISGDQITGIGLFCHEFSHTLGLPDIYDTAYSSNKIAMGEWDVMDMGGYNNAMRTPAGYSSYEKSVLGWIDPVSPIGKIEGFSLNSLGGNSEAIKLVSPANPDEYFMLETRSKSDRWDAYLPGEGLLITKVSYDKFIWDDNAVNSNGNWGVHLIPANGDFSSATDGASTPFPGTANVKVWTDLTTPSSVFDDGSYLGYAITNISFDGTKVTMDLGDSMEAPILTEPTDVTESGFRANWQRVKEAKFYLVELTNLSMGESVVYDKIVRNRYTFTDLDSEQAYSYRVRAIGDVLVSDYSEPQEISLNAYLGVEEIDVCSMDDIRIFDITGTYRGRDIDNLPSGFYIMKIGDTVTKIKK